MGDIEKLPYLSSGLTDHHEIWHFDPFDPPKPKIPTF